MTEYWKLFTHIRGFTSNSVLFEQDKVKLQLFLKDRSKKLILNLINVFYLFNSSCFVNLGRLNDNKIFFNNKDENLYYIKF